MPCLWLLRRACAHLKQKATQPSSGGSLPVHESSLPFFSGALHNMTENKAYFRKTLACAIYTQELLTEGQGSLLLCSSVFGCLTLGEHLQ